MRALAHGITTRSGYKDFILTIRPRAKNGVSVCARKKVTTSQMLAAKNANDANQRDLKTSAPWNSKAYAHASQWSLAMSQNTSETTKEPRLVLFIRDGKTSGRSVNHQTKYCAVHTLLNATNANV